MIILCIPCVAIACAQTVLNIVELELWMKIDDDIEGAGVQEKKMGTWDLRFL